MITYAYIILGSYVLSVLSFQSTTADPDFGVNVVSDDTVYIL